MLHSALANDFIDLYRMAKRYIRYVQAEDRDEEVWSELTRLSLQWGADKPDRPTSYSQVRRSVRLSLRLIGAYLCAAGKAMITGSRGGA
jgi:hypothetical protein